MAPPRGSTSTRGSRTTVRSLRHGARRAVGLSFNSRDLQRLNRIASLLDDLPEAVIRPAGERHLALCIRRKSFAYYLHDHHRDGRVCICCKSTHGQQQACVARGPERYYVPAYLGASGWVSLRLDLPRVNWAEVLTLLIESYRAQAPKLLAERV